MHLTPQLVPGPLGNADVFISEQVFERSITSPLASIISLAGARGLPGPPGFPADDPEEPMMLLIPPSTVPGPQGVQGRSGMDSFGDIDEQIEPFIVYPGVPAAAGTTTLPVMFASTRLLTSDYTVPASTGVVIPQDFEIASGFTLELASDAVMDVI